MWVAKSPTQKLGKASGTANYTTLTWPPVQSALCSISTHCSSMGSLPCSAQNTDEKGAMRGA